MSLKQTHKTEGGLNILAIRLFGMIVLTIFTLHQYTGLLRTYEFMDYIDWVAFPVFAFLLAEGFDKSSSKVRYFIRFLLFALIAEVPYNLLHGSILYPKAQNGMLTLCAAFAVLIVLNFVNKKFKNIIVNVLLGYILSKLVFTALSKFDFEFASFGVFFVVAFYLSNHVTYRKLCQLIMFAILVIYVESEYYLSVIIGEYQYSASFRILCFIPMILAWIYNGKKGPNIKSLNILFYAYYPLLLGGIYAYKTFF